ncbi:unnamed protein product [Adineta steineri]|uniref:Uncharacterized protein n=1 Tax=Adineta steineri TaxID=433720 RepID=A0A814HYJ6_9BILA|nr:unnamed protein product [Adineta steineri]CAF4103071.1 unnamed protein product [Adineta steineri]
MDKNVKKNMSLIAKGLAIASVISGVIGVGLGIDVVVNAAKNLNVSIGVSCILAIVALALNLIGAVITFMIK